MVELFIKLINMSIAASWLILFVLIFRGIFKGAPKWMNYLLWAMVAIRLICPISMESVLSLIPSQETVHQEIVYERQPIIHSGSDVIDEVVNPVVSTVFEAKTEDSINPIHIMLMVCSIVWIVGVGALAIYALVSYIRIRQKVAEAVLIKEDIWKCDHIDSAFIFGIFNPQIYIPSSMNEEQMEYVIAHERSHLKCWDMVWKPIGFLLLMIYWVNPIIWIAYICFCKDIELACDARVIEHLQAEEKKAYALALLECSVSHKRVLSCPVAFGEDDVENRVESILKYKKPVLWISIAAIVICVCAAMGFLTNPIEETSSSVSESNDSLSEELSDFEYDNIMNETALNEYLEMFGFPMDLLETMEYETKVDIQNRWLGAYHIVVCYYDKDWNCTSFEWKSGGERDEPENMEDMMLKTYLIYSNKTKYDKNNIEYMDYMRLYYYYEWLDLPQKRGSDDYITLTWDSTRYELVDGSFRKLDKYDDEGIAYVESGNSVYEIQDSAITWNVDLKGYVNAVPDRLYGYACFDIRPKEVIDKAGDMEVKASYFHRGNEAASEVMASWFFLQDYEE